MKGEFVKGHESRQKDLEVGILLWASGAADWSNVGGGGVLFLSQLKFKE